MKGKSTKVIGFRDQEESAPKEGHSVTKAGRQQAFPLAELLKALLVGSLSGTYRT